MDLELTGKTALATGASKGIGKASARGLAHEGVRVAICSRDATTLSMAAKEIGAGARGDVLAIPADLSRAEEVQRVAEDAAGRLGRIDILVNNAGATYLPGGAANAALINFTKDSRISARRLAFSSPPSRRPPRAPSGGTA